MKYTTPTMKTEMLETNDIIVTSGENYVIVCEGEGKGNITFDASKIF